MSVQFLVFSFGYFFLFCSRFRLTPAQRPYPVLCHMALSLHTLTDYIQKYDKIVFAHVEQVLLCTPFNSCSLFCDHNHQSLLFIIQVIMVFSVHTAKLTFYIYFWNAHIESTVTKAGKRLYVLQQLKRAGVSQCDLLSVYSSVIRPLVEYACPVWYTNLPVYLSDSTETVQKRSFRTIYMYPGILYSDAMEIVNVPTLYKKTSKIYARILSVLRTEHKLHQLLNPCLQVPYSLGDGVLRLGHSDN